MDGVGEWMELEDRLSDVAQTPKRNVACSRSHVDPSIVSLGLCV